MKYILFFCFVAFYSFSALAEKYFCKYNEFGLTKIITFDRITHSHFKICNSENCDKNRFEVIYVDSKNLIFGNIILKEKSESDKFQLVIIDKETNLFTASKISFPNSNINNEFVKGKCALN
tara:strand:+ start:307 stop:669 length:363 start_codon:yes stop_codon:yes gene_type:complete